MPYPSEIDNFEQWVDRNFETGEPGTIVKAEHYNSATDSIKRVQQTLGLNPQGSDQDVAARLARLEQAPPPGAVPGTQILRIRYDFGEYTYLNAGVNTFPLQPYIFKKYSDPVGGVGIYGKITCDYISSTLGGANVVLFWLDYNGSYLTRFYNVSSPDFANQRKGFNSFCAPATIPASWDDSKVSLKVSLQSSGFYIVYLKVFLFQFAE